MRHVTLTCKYHPHLRWSCKSIAYKPGYGYNGCRNIFFDGMYAPGATDTTPRWPYTRHDPATGAWIEECPCSGRDLILAPEDPDYGNDTIDNSHLDD